MFKQMDSTSSNLFFHNFTMKKLKKIISIVNFYIRLPYLTFIKLTFIHVPEIQIETLDKRSDHVAVMTGGPRGIGLSIVKKLCQLDYTIILGVRNISASEKSIDVIRKEGISTRKIVLFHLDLKSLSSVRQFANQVLSSTEGGRIDLLLNHAGVAVSDEEITEDNYESTFQVNYLSHFLLTNLLLRRLRDTSVKFKKSCQIICTSSFIELAGKVNFNQLENTNIFHGHKRYTDSKLLQIMHAITLQRKLDAEGCNIQSYACHPGMVPTRLWKSSMGPLANPLEFLTQPLCATLDLAATAILFPVLSKEITKGGLYLLSGKITSPNPQAQDIAIQEKLWGKSMELCDCVTKI